MGVHIVIFAGLVLLWLAYKKRWKPGRLLEDEKGRRLFFVVAVGGNLLGMAICMENSRTKEVPESFPMEESGYEKELTVAVGAEEPVEITVQIPKKEGDEEEGTVEMSQREPGTAEQIQEEILRCNQEQESSTAYYLPQTMGGSPLQWGYPQDHTGEMMSALCVAAAGMLLAAREREKEEEKKKYGEALMMDYPGLVMKFTLLIQAGMSVQEAFRRIAGDYEKRERRQRCRPAYEEVRKTCLEMESGVSQVEAYRNFGLRCGQLRYKTFSNLLIQNLRRGSQGLLGLLEQESIEAWEDRKRKARILGETASTKLLVPMILMLGVVLALLIIPACLSFYSG